MTSSQSDKKCGAFLPGADPARCVWCGVKAEEHDLSVVPSTGLNFCRRDGCHHVCPSPISSISELRDLTAYIDELEKRAAEQKEWEKHPKCEDNGVGDTMQVIANELRDKFAVSARGTKFDAARYYKEYRDGLYGDGWQRDETTSHEHVDSLEATVNAALNLHGGHLIVPTDDRAARTEEGAKGG